MRCNTINEEDKKIAKRIHKSMSQRITVIILMERKIIFISHKC